MYDACFRVVNIPFVGCILIMVTRNPQTASQSPAWEAARRWSSRGAAPLESFAGISSCVMKSRIQAMPASQFPEQWTYQVPNETSINVPIAQLLATNGPI